MTVPALLLLAAGLAAAAELGGHAPPETARGETPGSAALDERRAVLSEMWQRRILPPDHEAWSPADLELLGRLRRGEAEALEYLRTKPGGSRPWTSVRRDKSGLPRRLLTKEGHENYLKLLTQDALVYFASKGADAKRAFALLDWDGRRLFDPRGLLTEEGIKVYRRARLNLEVFWRSPTGEVFGTRRPPGWTPAPPPGK